MARSLKKGPYVHYKLEKKIAANVEANKKKSQGPRVASRRVPESCAAVDGGGKKRRTDGWGGQGRGGCGGR